MSLKYEDNVWGKERDDYNFYEEPKILEGTHVLKWAKEHVFCYPRDVQMPLRYRNNRKYNHLIRTMSMGRWRDFLLAERNNLGNKIIDRVLKDVACLQFTTAHYMQEMITWSAVTLKCADVFPEGGYGLWMRSDDEDEKPVSQDFIVYAEEKYTPIYVSGESYLAWMNYLLHSPYCDDIWSEKEDVEYDIEFVENVAILRQRKDTRFMWACCYQCPHYEHPRFDFEQMINFFKTHKKRNCLGK